MGDVSSAKMLGRYLVLLLLVAAGCATTREDRVRASAEFSDRLVSDTADCLSAYPGPLAFSNALVIARARTLKLAQQDLERELSRITRATAFSVFLPNIEAVYGRTWSNGDITASPLARVRDGSGVVDVGALVVTQPVFTPVAWTMFVEAGYGVRISDLVRDRASELLDVQVAACFYKAAVAERMVETYRLQMESGVALTNRIARLAAEGYARPAELARAEARLAGDELGLLEARHQSDKARSDLCEILSLWPLARFQLDGDSILGVVGLPWEFVDTNGAPRVVSREWLSGADCAEFVWQGLVNRKDLYAGDETVNLRKAQVVEALAGFLPNIVLGGGGAHLTIESLAAKGWLGGFAGTWALFEGFRTVQAYRAARAKREAEFKLQEGRMLAVVTSVADAWRNWHEADDRMRAARKLREATALDYEDAERRYADGQETLNRVLDKLAEKDAAEVRVVAVEYAAALAEVTLRQAMGLRLGVTEAAER